jgi:hypothetical protein
MAQAAHVASVLYCTLLLGGMPVASWGDLLPSRCFAGTTTGHLVPGPIQDCSAPAAATAAVGSRLQ